LFFIEEEDVFATRKFSTIKENGITYYFSCWKSKFNLSNVVGVLTHMFRGLLYHFSFI